MEAPLLRLMVEKGPKAGETLEKKPGTKVRIGRVVNGNNFTIKDDGISSKHLLIKVIDISWVIYDLDTSNGTFLNGVQLEPNTPFTLKDGDLIKIGELTSIKVCLGEEEEQQEEEPKPKQTKGLKKTEKSGVSDSTTVPVAGVENVKEAELNAGAAGPLRRNPRRGAVAAKKQQLPECSSVVETRGGRGRPRKIAASKNETVEEISAGVAVVNIGDTNKVLKPSVSAEKPNSASAEVDIGDSLKGKKIAESPKVQVGDSSKRKKVAVDNSEDIPADDEKSANEEKMTLEKLQKMTLGEWFDYLEVYLVKQIYKETDEIIDGMRARSEQFKKFMSEQQQLKTKSLGS